MRNFKKRESESRCVALSKVAVGKIAWLVLLVLALLFGMLVEPGHASKPGSGVAMNSLAERHGDHGDRNTDYAATAGRVKFKTESVKLVDMA
ncbi:MAG: hypothetical protein C0616_05755 [Desulfuromonas sp.]|nr:MAG: hypothetical protein C0616_05755 [Desulfuromonas sp.]